MSKITTEQHYKITLSKGSTYYGKTKHHIYERWGNHLQTSRLGIHKNKHIQEVYNKYGCDDWVFEVLSVEIGDLQHHNKIEFGYVQADPKALNIRRGRYALLDKDEEREHLNKYAQEYREENKTTILKNKKIRYENETPEQREKRRLYDSEKYYRNKEIKHSGDNKVV